MLDTFSKPYKACFFVLTVAALLVAAVPARAALTAKSYVDQSLTTALAGKEDITNKTTAISAASTDVQYPSAKAVNTSLGGKVSMTGDETIAGVKTFASIPIIPTAPLPAAP